MYADRDVSEIVLILIILEYIYIRLSNCPTYYVNVLILIILEYIYIFLVWRTEGAQYVLILIILEYIYIVSCLVLS